MKKIGCFVVLTAIFLSFSLSLCAEVKSFIYAKVYFVSAGGLLSDECNMALDLGCRMKASMSFDYLEGNNGKPLRFNSTIDGLNYLGRDGWEVVGITLPVDSGSTGRTYFFMKKETTGMSSEEVLRFINHYNIRHKKADR